MDSDDDCAFMDSADIGSTDDGTPPTAAAETKTTPLQSLNSLPFNRRDMDQWNKEFCTAVEYKPKMINLFEPPPPFTVRDSNDNVSLQRLQEYFTTKYSRKRQLTDTVSNNTEISGNHIKKQLCHIDLGYLQAEQLKYEIEKLREEFAVLSSKTQMLHKENGALKTRLSKYEATDAIDRQRTQDARNYEKKKDAALEKQRQVIQQVENFLDERPGAVATLRKQFDYKENVRTQDARIRAKKKDAALEKQQQVIQQVENLLDERPGAVATLRRRFDYKENVTQSATTTTRKPRGTSVRPTRYPPSVTTISTSSSGSNESTTPFYTNAPRSQGQHRRSQSVTTPIRSRK